MSTKSPKQTEQASTAIPQVMTTPECILSYPHLFKPQAPMEKGGKAQYSAALVFTPEAQQTPEFKAMKAVVKALLQQRWGGGITVGKKKLTLADALRAGKIQTPFKADAEEKGYPAGSVYINVGRKEEFGAPQIVSIYPDAEGKPSLVTDQTKVYPGVIVLVTVRPYTWDYEGMKRGVSFGLGNVQIRRDGERLDSQRAARDEFEADSKAAASLESLNDASANTDVEEAQPEAATDVAEEVGDDLADLF